ncbi:PAS domain-containing protein, partial [Marispirochaeta aestuarii]|uniref:PAS domain-containing protein n=1 Tax=Marispirochaeta aestuarii TaxID=1963862 RepID=UPI0029C605D4
MPSRNGTAGESVRSWTEFSGNPPGNSVLLREYFLGFDLGAGEIRRHAETVADLALGNDSQGDLSEVFSMLQKKERFLPLLEEVQELLRLRLREGLPGVDLARMENLLDRLPGPGRCSKATTRIPICSLKTSVRRGPVRKFLNRALKKIGKLNIDQIRSLIMDVVQENELLEMVLYSMTDGVVVLDEKHSVILLNKAAERLFPFKNGDVVERPLWDALADSSLSEFFHKALVEHETSRTRRSPCR